MKLRTRLFVWIGILFFLAFGVALFFETYSTDKSLSEAEEALKQKIMEAGEERRKHVEEYLHVSLTEDQAQIDSLLLRIGRDPDLGPVLYLDSSNIQLTAPAHSALLFKNDRWIDLIQSTKNGKLTSLFTPIDFPMSTAHRVPIDDILSWVVLDSDRQLDRPFIGIRLPNWVKEDPRIDFSQLFNEMVEVDWGLTILFHPESLLNFKEEESTTSAIAYGVDIPIFLKRVQHASQYLNAKAKDKGWIQKDIREKSNNQIFTGKLYDLGIRCLEEEGEVLNNRIIQLLQEGDQAVMISALAGLFPGGAFGPTLFSPKAPKGIARFPRGAKTGHLLFTDEVFKKTALFNDRNFSTKHPSLKECEGIGNTVAVIPLFKTNQVFIGNTLKITKGSEEGYLTVAIDADEFLQDLVLSLNQSGFLVTEGRVFSAFDQKGGKIVHPEKVIPFDKKMLNSKSGIVSWEGKNYYYLHMIPFKDVDLHFYVLQPEKEAFALVSAVKEGSREVIKSVSFNMRLIALIALFFVLLILHRLAKRITGPISQLARVTQDVAEGKLEGIELPPHPKGKGDEVATLITSFDQMITGLKEKEKVKGVLNKVVSPEIAKEITQGTIHLGGEEKKVTVLFADIRNFTKMSTHLKPTEVIELLNTCMTKVSHVIDEFGGVIDKYVGDEVMALFGAPIEKEDSTLKAVQCALNIVNVLKQWNQERSNKGLEPVEMGIGIHTGTVLVGNMGAENRLNYTVIGNNVNFAARLCSAAKGLEILISKETLSEPHVRESIEVEEIPPMEMKGYEEKQVLYKVKGSK